MTTIQLVPIASSGGSLLNNTYVMSIPGYGGAFMPTGAAAPYYLSTPGAELATVSVPYGVPYAPQLTSTDVLAAGAPAGPNPTPMPMPMPSVVTAPRMCCNGFPSVPARTCGFEPAGVFPASVPLTGVGNVVMQNGLTVASAWAGKRSPIMYATPVPPGLYRQSIGCTGYGLPGRW